jgi:small GTP-binding protein
VIQKKICMVGMFATGKTSLVQKFVYSKFSEKYHSTVGVKIDRKQVEVEGTTVNLLLWDLAGKDEFQDVPASYLRGSGGLFYVVDGTRRETLEQLYALHEMAHETVGDVPTTVALNKKDLTDQWLLRTDDYDTLSDHGLHALGTSAKTGEGVEEAFLWLAAATIKS